MKAILKFCAVSGVALAVGAGAAMADTNSVTKKRKASLFESLFGGPSKPRTENRKRRFLFGKRDDSSFGDVRIIRDGEFARASESDISTSKSRRTLANDGDPEGDPGLGMGNLPYVSPKLVGLNGMKLSEPRPSDSSASALYDSLSGEGPSFRVIPEIRDALLAQYKAQSFRPIWLAGSKLSDRGVAVLKLLADADSEGLEAQSYLPSGLTAFDAALPENDTAAMARLDIDLSAAALKYARDASGGQFDPRRLSLYNDVDAPWINPSQAIKVLAWSPFAADYLRSLQPAHPAYAAMKAALAELRKESGAAPAAAIEDGAIVKKGGIDARIPAVRQRLADLGYAEALDAADDPEVLDADLGVQLRLFQKASGIKVTGSLGPQTVAALNADTHNRDTAKLLDNMERLRWLPKSLGQRYVFVNQAAFEARVMDGQAQVWKTRVIVGKPLTQTAVFHDEMEMVVFNPSWGVPPSIIANEYLPKLRRDPGYLDRIGFKVVNDKGKVVSSRSVSWSSYGSKVPFGIQQPPGVKNALGEIKFLFPNAHNIYMHDTPNRELFDNEVRAFSHGCVRVQNPRDFASVILGWDRSKVDENVESKQSETIRLKQKIPVHITYFTAWPDENGKIQYFNDIYGRDKAMETARSSVVLAQR